MPQISLYIDKETLARISRLARHERTSISKWVGRNLKALLDDEYPEGYFSAFGAIADDSFKRPDSPDHAHDIHRTAL